MSKNFISIQDSLAELERCAQDRALALNCFRSAVKDVAHYCLELDQRVDAYRAGFAILAEEVAKEPVESLSEKSATLRNLLRSYRDKGREYVNQLRTQLASTEQALQAVMNALAQADGEQEKRILLAVDRLRKISSMPEVSAVRSMLLEIAKSINEDLAEARKQHKLTLSQLQAEITVLHNRIDAMEAASKVDSVTSISNRSQMEDQIRSQPPGGFCLFVVSARGLRLAANRFGPDVSLELATAFVKRMMSVLPSDAVVARWAEEDFVAMAHLSRTDAIRVGKILGEQLAGQYAFVKNNSTVRPSLNIRVCIIDTDAHDEPERAICRIAATLALTPPA